MQLELAKETKIPLPMNRDEYADKKLLHICEVCGKEELLTPREGYDKGWDYAPYMYPFKVISPRTCETCGIEKTVWFQNSVMHTPLENLTDKQKDTVKRILNEPESITPKE